MYVITDVVECGDDKYIGGTTDLKANIPSMFEFNEEFLQEIRNIFDSFDHCLITTNPEASKFCQRYHLIDNHTHNFFRDVEKAMAPMLREAIKKALMTITSSPSQQTMTIQVMRGKEGIWFDILVGGM